MYQIYKWCIPCCNMGYQKLPIWAQLKTSCLNLHKHRFTGRASSAAQHRTASVHVGLKASVAVHEADSLSQWRGAAPGPSGEIRLPPCSLIDASLARKAIQYSLTLYIYIYMIKLDRI